MDGTVTATNAGADGVYIKWDNVTYDVEKNTKQILHGISGSVAPGEMLAIMGPSGCGKSSLINILAQRRRGEDSVGGTVEVNGAAIDHAQFARLVGYVTQDFVFFEHLTVKETLTISALLRLPRGWKRADKLARVDQLLQDLDLTKAADTMVGSPVATGASAGAGGISGGERRRLCMAMELMNNAPLLFLDEPTSGLDSASALMVVNVLKRLASQGKTIVCVIHQPRASILPLFSRVLLLGQGHTVYYGPSVNFTAQTDPLRDFFTEAGYPCPAFENPADHILDIINTTVGADEETAGAAEGKVAGAKAEKTAICGSKAAVAAAAVADKRSEVVDALVKRYAASAFPAEMTALMSKGDGSPLPALEGVEVGRRYATSWLTQFAVLFVRTVRLKYRDPMSFWTVVGGVISVSILMGSIYSDLEPGDVRNRISGIAMYISFMSFMTFDILMLWPAERSVYLRDQIAGMYCTSAFYIARSFAEMPTHALSGALGGLITYYMLGLATVAENVLMYIAVSIITIYSASAIMMFVSGLAKNFEQSNQLLMPVLLPCMFFSGFFIPEDMVPAGWSWVPDVNFLYYSTNYAVVREIQSMEGGCSAAAAALTAELGCANATVGVALLGSAGQLEECNAVLRANGFDPDMTFVSFLMCHIWTNVLFRLLSYIGLRFCWTGQTCKQRLAV